MYLTSDCFPAVPVPLSQLTPHRPLNSLYCLQFVLLHNTLFFFSPKYIDHCVEVQAEELVLTLGDKSLFNGGEQLLLHQSYSSQLLLNNLINHSLSMLLPGIERFSDEKGNLEVLLSITYTK